MRLIRPEWLSHHGEKKDHEVYSCHVSPDGSRLATAAGDGHVRVWSTEAIFMAGDSTYAKPKQLASMSHHSGTIHSVRFSGNGRYLASGADDKIVCVYSFDPNAPAHAATFGTNEAPAVENWRLFRRLIGHDNDVQDLGWSCDSSILVSVGLDSKVVVWSGHTFEKLKTLANHQSHVKGLTFDPANKYFATASDDRTIKVFRFTPPGPNATSHDQAGNFILEASIDQPFTSSPLTTYFRRCSWSPDGMHIAAANATNGPVSSVAVINRGTWDGDIHLIGHEGPVEACAFSPRLFQNQPADTSNQDASGFSSLSLVTVIACAGQDKALSIWNTSQPRPLLITQELASKAISDLAWSPEGTQLFVTSLDGSILALWFEDGDLGYVVNKQENEKSLSKFGVGRRGAGVVEGPESLRLEEQSREGERRGVEGRMGELMGDVSAGPNGSTNGANAPSTGETAIPPVSDTNRAIATNGQTNGQSNNEQATNEPKKDANQIRIEKIKQRVTIDANGRKRVAPMNLSTIPGVGERSLPKSQLMKSSSMGSISRNDGPQTILDLSKPFDGLPPGGLAAMLLGNRRKLANVNGEQSSRLEKQIANASRNGAVPILSNGVDGLQVAQPQATQIGPQTTPEWIRPAILNPSLSLSQVRLAVPKLRALIVRNIDSSGNIVTNSEGVAVEGSAIKSSSQTQNVDSILEVKNPSGLSLTGRAADREPARISVTRRGQNIWQDFLPRSVILVTGNQNFWSTACEDGSIYTWTPAGRRSMNAIVVESQPVMLESRGWWLLCITAAGMCYVWNLKTQSSPHPPVSLAPVLEIASQHLQAHTTSAPAVTSARLNSNGHMIVTLSNGDAFTYAPAMFAWQRLSEVWWAVGSQYWNSTDSSVSVLQSSGEKADTRVPDGELNAANISAGIIPYMERNTTDECLLKGRAYYLQRLMKQLLSKEGYEGFESGVSIGHLENRIAAALQLGARDEFRQYLLMYAKRLGAEGMRGKVEELLKTLMGDVLVDQNSQFVTSAAINGKHGRHTSDESICGWPRHELMKAVVLILGKHREFQRLTVPYAKILGVLDETEYFDEGDEMVMV